MAEWWKVIRWLEKIENAFRVFSSHLKSFERKNLYLYGISFISPIKCKMCRKHTTAKHKHKHKPKNINVQRTAHNGEMKIFVTHLHSWLNSLVWKKINEMMTVNIQGKVEAAVRLYSSEYVCVCVCVWVMTNRIENNSVSIYYIFNTNKNIA